MDPNITVVPCAPDGASAGPQPAPIEAARQLEVEQLRGVFIQAAMRRLDPQNTEQFSLEGTIPRALAGILDQVGAPVVVVNALERTAVAQEAVAFVGDTLELGPRRWGAQLADVVLETAGAITATVGIGAGAAAITVSAATSGADPDLNTPTAIAAGKVTFSFDFTPVNPAERVTFQSALTNDYLEDLV